MLSSLNKYLSINLRYNYYVFFIKYIYPIFILKKIDFNSKFGISKEFFTIKTSNFKNFYYYNITRSARYSSGGFVNVGKYLFKKYLLENISINKQDTVIEIGANVGELTHYLTKFNPFIYAFDIEQKAIDCLTYNLRGYKKKSINKLAIWKNSGFFEFSSYSDDASSTLLFYKKDKKNLKIKKIKAVSLDQFFKKKKIKKIKLIKIEAEGAEPEILQGALNILKKTQFVSIDVGPERYSIPGVVGKSPLLLCKKILIKNNFKLLITKDCCLGINKKYLQSSI